MFFPFYFSSPLASIFGPIDGCLCIYFLFFCLRRVWPISNLVTWYVVCFQTISFRQSKWNLSIYLLKTSPIPSFPWPPNLVGWWLNRRCCYRQSHMTLWSRNLTRSHDKLKTTSASECQWTPKLDRMVNYLEGLPHIQLLDSFVTWSCEIPWQTKTILSPVLQCLWPPILAGCWLTFPGSYPESHMTFNQEFLQDHVTG